MARERELGWDLEALNKAYRQGYMSGLIHMDKAQCPYQSDVVIAAWEAGWDDGSEESAEHQRTANIA